MTISYNWLSEYLPQSIEPEKLEKILTSIGLEVETLEPYETVKGGLKGLIIGEVISCEKHPDADKLSLTKVNIGGGEPLQIVCGAPNVGIGQKVVVATVGTTIFPTTGEPLTMKNAKIRGVESQGMICAEDEIGIGNSHAGILILPNEAGVGTPAADYFKPYQDWIYEIGLTPNRMDAMSHLGVAKDVTAWLNHHTKKGLSVKSPLKSANIKPEKTGGIKIEVSVENNEACQRYAGVSISGVTIKESPVWLQNKLKAIGLRPISNVVDITNFILHETGQPLHAFDAAKISGKKIIVKNLPNDTAFITLDGKERRLKAEDLMICDGLGNGLCMAGVFGGFTSGVSATTTDIFLESAWFHPVSTRKTSVAHGLRTDAATRFEKGVDISNTALVLKRAAQLITEICGGHISSEVIDVYPNPKERLHISLKYHYLKKLSGKNYHPDTVRNILESLGFEFLKEGADDFWFAVPYSKPDITLPADIVEEIMRIDGYDNVEIPQSILVAPSADELNTAESWREKISSYLTGAGFAEILTNSITNSAYYSETEMAEAVKMMNNLSVELDVLRPSMLETGLEIIAHNLNRRNNQLQFFEFGKTYHSTEVGMYRENTHCCLYITGQQQAKSWNNTAAETDFYYLKGMVQNLFGVMQIEPDAANPFSENEQEGLRFMVGQTSVATIVKINEKKLQKFGIKQPVFFADLNWDALLLMLTQQKISYTEISKFPGVERDLAIVVDQTVTYAQIEKATKNAKAAKLKSIQLFDIFESEKLGNGKKSMAINFTFTDAEKTLTDKEIEGMMQRLIYSYEKEVSAEIRK